MLSAAGSPEYTERVGGNITTEGKRALSNLVLAMREDERRGTEGAVVDVLLRLAENDDELKGRIAAELPPRRKRRR